MAGGTGPTSGDFMLLFALEGLVAKPKILQTLLPRGKTVEGSSIKAYVDLLHARWVLSFAERDSMLTLRDYCSRPAYQKVCRDCC